AALGGRLEGLAEHGLPDAGRVRLEVVVEGEHGGHFMAALAPAVALPAATGEVQIVAVEQHAHLARLAGRLPHDDERARGAALLDGGGARAVELLALPARRRMGVR